MIKTIAVLGVIAALVGIGVYMTPTYDTLHAMCTDMHTWVNPPNDDYHECMAQWEQLCTNPNINCPPVK